MKTPKLSIIIPVYNVEKYLSECLDSIKNQVFSDFECLLVDDGSSDESGKICDYYGGIDSRFIVIHKKNEGVSKARNTGLDNSKGEWISFIDSDDWIDKETYDVIFRFIEKNNNVEQIQWGIKTISNNIILEQKDCPEGYFSINKSFEYFEPSVCHKLFKKELVIKNNIRFPEDVNLSEDRYFALLCYLYSKSNYFISNIYYNYRIYSESSSHKMSKEQVCEEISVIDKMAMFVNNNKEYDALIQSQKIEAKNHFLFLIKRPNFHMWRKYYPELNRVIIANSKGLKKIYFLLVNLHCDLLIRFLFFIFNK